MPKNAFKVAAALDAAATLGLLYMLHAAHLGGLTIVQLSDFHVGFRPSFNLRAMRKAVDMALAARPDVVLITGDFACGPHGRDELQRQLRRLADAAQLGVFGVLGNHDHGDSKAPFVMPTDPRLIEDCGVCLLDNRTASVKLGAATVQIGGVDDTDGGHDDLPAVLAALDRRPGVLRILLTHHAEVVLRTEPGDFHIALAGDTHGGQICLPLPGCRILLSDLSAPFVEGAYEVGGGRLLYVTRGVGTSMLPLRAFCRPEIVVFHVEAGAPAAAGPAEASW